MYLNEKKQLRKFIIWIPFNLFRLILILVLKYPFYYKSTYAKILGWFYWTAIHTHMHAQEKKEGKIALFPYNKGS